MLMGMPTVLYFQICINYSRKMSGGFFYPSTSFLLPQINLKETSGFFTPRWSNLVKTPEFFPYLLVKLYDMQQSKNIKSIVDKTLGNYDNKVNEHG